MAKPRWTPGSLAERVSQVHFTCVVTATQRALIANLADEVEAEIARFRAECETIPELKMVIASRSAQLAAADRIARRVLNWTHGEDCAGSDDDGDMEMCAGCSGGVGPCTCTCGMDAAWRDCLIIRPQGVRDPQPAEEAGTDD